MSEFSATVEVNESAAMLRSIGGSLTAVIGPGSVDFAPSPERDSVLVCTRTEAGPVEFRVQVHGSEPPMVRPSAGIELAGRLVISSLTGGDDSEPVDVPNGAYLLAMTADDAPSGHERNVLHLWPGRMDQTRSVITGCDDADVLVSFSGTEAQVAAARIGSEIDRGGGGLSGNTGNIMIDMDVEVLPHRLFEYLGSPVAPSMDWTVVSDASGTRTLMDRPDGDVPSLTGETGAMLVTDNIAPRDGRSDRSWQAVQIIDSGYVPVSGPFEVHIALEAIGDNHTRAHIEILDAPAEWLDDLRTYWNRQAHRAAAVCIETVTP